MSSLEERSLLIERAFPIGALRGLSSRPLHDPSLDGPTIAILMCTFNGAEYLGDQLASIEQQAYRNWQLIVSDDGSTDSTRDIIRNFAQRVSQHVELRQGPGRGPSANFMTLAADSAIEADFFAFCDQDDVWHPDKLAQALRQLQTIHRDLPAVYGGSTRLVAADGKPFGYSPCFAKPPSFANALAQCIAGGNTMLFNPATKRLFELTGPVDVISHDWWAYQLVSGAGGHVLYDRSPRLDYRQHGGNRIGCNRGIAAQWKRFRMVLDGGFSRWNDVNLRALRGCRQLLTPDARAQLALYERMRAGGFTGRIKAFMHSRIRRQTLSGNAALLTAVLLNKV